MNIDNHKNAHKVMEINIDSSMYASLIIYEQARVTGIKVAIHAPPNTPTNRRQGILNVFYVLYGKIICRNSYN